VSLGLAISLRVFRSDLFILRTMPTYVYRRDDGTTFEIQQRITADPLEECPETGQPVERIIQGSAGLIFKGDGFYVNDYSSSKGGNPKDGNGASTENGSKDSGSKDSESTSNDASKAEPSSGSASNGSSENVASDSDT